MKHLLRTLLPLVLAGAVLPAAAAAPADIFARSNLVAWCIVPFDSKKRGPAERAEMVAKLGFGKVAYDWRQEHVAEFETEILEYKKRGLDYFAFWAMHEEAFKQFAKHGLHPQIWMTAPSPAGATQAERVEKAAAQLLPSVERARKAGCQFGLYNHGGWGGEPENMVAICELLRTKNGATNVGIIYNQHHGHDHVDRFAKVLGEMKPYLLCLNLNGMTRDGEKRGQKILPLGSGEIDLSLLKIIRDSGYRGPIGIIGHTNDDVEQRLRDNLDGLDWLLPQLDGKPAGPKPKYRTVARVGALQAPSTAPSTTPERRLQTAGTNTAASAPIAKPTLLYTKLPTREQTEQTTTAATLKQLPPAQLASIHTFAAAPTLKPDGSADVPAAKTITLPNAQWTTLDAATKSLLFTLHADAEREVTLRIGCKRPVQTKFNNGPLPSEIGPPGWLAGQIGNIADPVAFHLKLRAGDNFLSLTFTETAPFYFELDPLGHELRTQLNARLTADFPPTGEARYYKIETVALPGGLALEVGGMAFAADNSLMICTRRGEIWRYVSAAVESECAKPGLNRAAMLRSGAGVPPAKAVGQASPPAASPAVVPTAASTNGRDVRSTTAAGTAAPLPPLGDRWELFASGLHEPLGLLVGKPGEVFVVQRSELTRIVDTDGDGKADLFETLDQNCGVSASQHAYIFGPVRDKAGNLWGAISGIGVSGPGKYFGWSFKVTPSGEFIPWSKGLRSPNGLCMTPDGDLFITDNQGEWMGTSPLHHISKDAFHGHPQGLKWDANFKGEWDKATADELAPLRKLPAIQFPYGTMGQSLAEPVVDTTGGKFGPFAGQMFVCDESKCLVVRVALEKVDGEWQGACLPFRVGFQGGNNRAAFAPDGSLFVGQTDRGWGSTGGKSFGLQRVVWSGEVPFEIETMKLTADGFDVRFTQPVDKSAAATPANWSLSHYHYLYRAAYGSPQQDITPVKVTSASVSADGRTVRLKLPKLRTGKIYELHHANLRAADGTAPLHTAAYYTLNRVGK